MESAKIGNPHELPITPFQSLDIVLCQALKLLAVYHNAS